MTMGPEGLQYGISGRFLRVGGRPALETAGCRAGRSPWKASSTATVVGVNECKRLITTTELLQLRVFRLGFFQDRDLGVGVFPEREEILICRLGFGGVALHGIGSTDLEMRECSNGFVEHNTAMVEDFLELGGGFAALMRG